MGSRANYFLVRDGTRSTLTSPRGAAGLAFDMFWGPERAIPFVERLAKARGENLLDAAGGAVVDIDNHVLLLFGGGVQSDVPLRRMYLELAQATWFGWEVRWSMTGQLGLADYLGLPHNPFLAADAVQVDSEEKRADPLKRRKRRGAVNTMVSVRLRHGELRLYPIWLPSKQAPMPIAGLVAAATDRPAPGRIDWTDWTRRFPAGGLHLDAGMQHGVWWAADTHRPIFDRSGSPEWTIETFDDRFEAQLVETGDCLRFPERSQADLVAQLRGILGVRRLDPLHGQEKRTFAAALEALRQAQ